MAALTAKELEAERHLVEASQKDSRCFSDLYERYFNRIYAFALTRTGDREAAEDVTADTFRQAFCNLPQFKWRGVPFSAWLFRIATNAAAKHRQRAAHYSTLDALPDTPAQSWDEPLVEVEQRTQLLDLVKRLPRDQRQVIVMRFGQEKSTREVAQDLGRSEGAVKQLQFRALKNLRGWVGESYE
jgi:RNA polymerase sigma-70 factor (ECF subfamily)